MFSADLTLTNVDASTQTYSQISLVDAKCIRKDATKPMSTPAALTISHQSYGKGLNVRDKHLVRLDHSKADTDADDNSVLSCSTYFVIDNPQRLFTEAEIADMINQLAEFLGGAGNLTKILNGEP